VLETDFETDDGLVRLVDCMPLGEGNNVVRIVEGLRGRVAMEMQVRPRFDYGRLIPAIGGSTGASSPWPGRTRSACVRPWR
jgi:hypothetical protein